MPQTNRVIPSSETLLILFPLTLRLPLFCLTLPVAWVLPSQRGLFPKARVWQHRVKVSMAANIRKQPKLPKIGGQAPGTASHSLLTPCLLARLPLSVDVIPTSVWWSFLGWLQDGCSGGRRLSQPATAASRGTRETLLGAFRREEAFLRSLLPHKIFLSFGHTMGS